MASFTKEVNTRLAKRPLVLNGPLANHWLISLVKEAAGGHYKCSIWYMYIYKYRYRYNYRYIYIDIDIYRYTSQVSLFQNVKMCYRNLTAMVAVRQSLLLVHMTVMVPSNYSPSAVHLRKLCAGLWHYIMWDEITYPFLNFNGATVAV